MVCFSFSSCYNYSMHIRASMDRKLTSTLKQNIDEILEVLENEDTANEQDKKDTAHLGEELHSNWDSLHTVLAVFIDHSRLEDIDQSIAVIAECLKKDEESDFYVESAKLKAQLEHLKDTELPTISNIL